MTELIEYCLANVPPAVRDRLPDGAEGEPCLGHCGLCYDGPLLVVDGRLERAGDFSELLADVEEADS